MDELKWSITEQEAGQRVDKFLVTRQEDWSRTKLQHWAKNGRIIVNGEAVKSNYVLRDRDTVVLYPEEEPVEELTAEDIPLDIYYEDEDIIVVNKPRGMVVHPAPGHTSGTLVNALLFHCGSLSQCNGEWRPGIVHRIDKDTSGLLVAAKRDEAHIQLKRQMQKKKIERVYKAIVHGTIPHDTGTIEAPIGRDPKDRQKMAVLEKNAKDAVTHFNVLERWKDYSFIECKLETGRTHQIRVHLAYIGHPLAGDPKYGRAKTLSLSGQALHAGRLALYHPAEGTPMSWEAPLPFELTQILDNIRKGY
ncbi:RluA family pseudouridine synthase [Salibacterium aidingense]|uniref:RluA family pseudouridine synthase n=1 Tax=Salibacterium aidingense TaxID=384933 RepID=UPI0003F9EF3E|nr:RluA family pseudouridine synthase [Salibacterium aidingense]